jgi:hypothetical protein
MVALETYAGAALAANAIWTLFDQRRYEDVLPAFPCPSTITFIKTLGGKRSSRD